MASAVASWSLGHTSCGNLEKQVAFRQVRSTESLDPEMQSLLESVEDLHYLSTGLLVELKVNAGQQLFQPVSVSREGVAASTTTRNTSSWLFLVAHPLIDMCLDLAASSGDQRQKQRGQAYSGSLNVAQSAHPWEQEVRMCWAREKGDDQGRCS